VDPSVSVVEPWSQPGGWLERWISEFGVALGGGRYRITASQADLARAEGASAGTINERIRRAEAAGVVVSRKPLVVVADHGAGRTQPASGVQQARYDALDALVRLMRADGATAAVISAVQEVAGALEPDVAAIPRLRGLPTAEPRSEISPVQSIQSPLLIKVKSSSTSPHREEPAGPRSRAAKPEGGGECLAESSERAAWDVLVSELGEAARASKLPDRPLNAARLWELAYEVGPEERTRAMRRLTEQINGVNPHRIKDPFGVAHSIFKERRVEYLAAVDPSPAIDEDRLAVQARNYARVVFSTLDGCDLREKRARLAEEYEGFLLDVALVAFDALSERGSPE
jgi:DNA-binding Lrp family transcriptional regulator